MSLNQEEKIMIRLSNIHLSFQENELIKQGDMIIPSGIVTLLRGESGCGKTTLLMSIGLLSQQVEMDYLFDHIDIHTADESTLSCIRQNEISFIFQETYLFDHMNLIENIQFYAALSYHELTEEEIRKQLDFVGLDLDFHTQIRSMSGGEKQRLAIVCGLLKDAKLFIFDEPTSYLDNENRQIIISIIDKLAHEKNKMVLIVSHDEHMQEIANQIYEFQDKQIVCVKTTPYQKSHNELKWQPLNMKILYQYIYKKNKRLSLVIGIILGVVLTGFTVSFVYNIFYGVQDEKAILSSIHHKVYLMKADGLFITATDQVKLQEYFRDYQLYPEIDSFTNVSVGSKTIENIYIKPYYSHSIEDTHLLKSYRPRTYGSIYATYELYHFFENSLDNGVKVKEKSMQLSGILYPNYDIGYALYIPYDFLKEELKTIGIELGTIPVSRMAINIDSLEDYRSINQNLSKDYLLKTNIDVNAQINMLSFFKSSYLIVFLVIVLIVLIIYKTYRVIDDKRNIALLKILGVNFKSLMKMKTFEEFLFIIPMAIISIILSSISIYYLKIETLAYFRAGGIITLNLFIILLVDIVIYFIFLKKYSAAVLIRND